MAAFAALAPGFASRPFGRFAAFQEIRMSSREGGEIGVPGADGGLLRGYIRIRSHTFPGFALFHRYCNILWLQIQSYFAQILHLCICNLYQKSGSPTRPSHELRCSLPFSAIFSSFFDVFCEKIPKASGKVVGFPCYGFRLHSYRYIVTYLFIFILIYFKKIGRAHV